MRASDNAASLTVQTVPQHAERGNRGHRTFAMIPERDVDWASIPVSAPVPTVWQRCSIGLTSPAELDPLLFVGSDARMLAVGGGGKVDDGGGLNVALMGTGRGTVEACPPGCACAAACSASVPTVSLCGFRRRHRGLSLVGWTGRLQTNRGKLHYWIRPCHCGQSVVHVTVRGVDRETATNPRTASVGHRIRQPGSTWRFRGRARGTVVVIKA